MRKVVLTMQTTLDGRIAHADGSFWEPFAWGEPEQGYLNHYFRAADTWAMSRVLYDAVVPFWDAVAMGRPPADAGELGPPTSSSPISSTGCARSCSPPP